MYNLTHYEEYPIYEPAEGGYYYAGNQVVEGFKFLTKWGAKRQLAKMRGHLEALGFTVLEDKAYLSSKYVGEGQSWIVEKKCGSHSRGKQVYQ